FARQDGEGVARFSVETLRRKQRSVLCRTGLGPVFEAILVDEVDRLSLLAAVRCDHGGEVGHGLDALAPWSNRGNARWPRQGGTCINMLLAISRQFRRFMSLRANLETEPRTGERRSAPRRKLRLQAEGAIPSAGDTQVVIHDISEEGLLIESPLPLTDGEVLEVLIPEAGTAQAEVSWTSGHFYGC